MRRGWAVFVLLAGGWGCTPVSRPRDTATPPGDAGVGQGDAGEVSPDGGQVAPDAGPTRPPSIHFWVNDRPEDSTQAELEVTESRYGDPARVVVVDLEPQAQVAVVGTMDGMESSATFVANAQGVVDLGRDAPVSGTWAAADLDGIFWSMARVQTAPSVLDLDLVVQVIKEGPLELCQGTLHRRYINEGLVTQRVASGRTVGMFARPAGAGPFPGVLVFGGSEGGTASAEFDAQYWASLGFAALGVGYFGAAGLPAQLEEVPVEILGEALAYLGAHDHVDAQRLAVMGGSRGGELALILGARLPNVKAVVAQVPSGLVWGATTGANKSAWTWQGVPLPFVPASGAQPQQTTDSAGVIHYTTREVFLADIDAATPAQLEAATTHVEDTHGPVLLYGGAVDQLWPSCPLAQRAFDRLNPSSVLHHPLDQNLCWEGAGHGVGTPGWSTLDVGEAYLPSVQAYLVLGGTPEATARAQRQADTAVRKFLHAALQAP